MISLNQNLPDSFHGGQGKNKMLPVGGCVEFRAVVQYVGLKCTGGG